MALHKPERRNYWGKLSVSIKYQSLHTFKEGLILLCQSILETRRITHLHGSAHFTIPLIHLFYIFLLLCSDYFADLIKKLEFCLTVVSVLLKIRFGHAQISMPKTVYQCRKQAVSTPDLLFQLGL